MKKLILPCLALLTLAACNDKGTGTSSSSSGKTSSNSVAGSTSASLNGVLTTSYEITEDSCPTGRQTFRSREELCRGLQNESLNSGCAQRSRAQKFATDCPGQAFTPFFEENNGQPLPKEFAVRALKVGVSVLDIPQLSPNGISPIQSELVILSCTDSASSAIRSENQGFQLLSGSKAVIHRDLNYRFGDGTRARNVRQPYVLVDCHGESSDLEILTHEVEKRSLKRNDQLLDIAATSPRGSSPFSSSLFIISCIGDPVETMQLNQNGVYLLPGSRLFLVRDRSYVFGDGTSARDSKPYSLVSCE